MAGSTRQSRNHKKWLTARRAQWKLKQAFDTIDFVEDVLGPESEAMLSGKVALEIEAASEDAAHSIIRVTVQDETEAEDVEELIVEHETSSDSTSS